MSNLIDISKLNLNTIVKVNKVSITEPIFVENYKKLDRKTIIALFQQCEAKMTPAGASTYYQNFKKKYDGLIKAQQELEAQQLLNDNVETVTEVVKVVV